MLKEPKNIQKIFRDTPNFSQFYFSCPMDTVKELWDSDNFDELSEYFIGDEDFKSIQSSEEIIEILKFLKNILIADGCELCIRSKDSLQKVYRPFNQEIIFLTSNENKVEGLKG